METDDKFTKAQMRKFLRYKINQLDKTMESKKFYKRVEELFYKLRRITVPGQTQDSLDRSMDIWEENFYLYAQRLEYNEKMREHSVDKRYYKPSLGPRFCKDSYGLIKLHIDFSSLPK